MTVYTSVLQRTYLLRVGTKCGTGYFHVQDGHVFMVTAKHIFDGQRCDRIEVFYDNMWKSGNVETRFAGYGIDLAVVLTPIEAAQPTNATLKVDEFHLGHDVFAVGFPLSLYQPGTPEEPDVPLPFVSKGCVSAVEPRKGVFISGQIDEGYSGGPVALTAVPDQPAMIIGFVSHNIRRKVSHELDSGREVIVSQPTNLIYAVLAKVALDVIDAWCTELRANG